MPNREKWGDFVKIHVVSKPHKQNGKCNEDYAQFRCPYLCNEFVELPEANIKNTKASKCRTHLMTCSGVAADGRRAQDDPRVCIQRKAASECKLYMQKAKQELTDGMDSASDTTLALREEITTLTATNDSLTTKNDGLKGRLDDIESKMEEMKRESQEMKRESQEVKRESQEVKRELQEVKREFQEVVSVLAGVTRGLGIDAKLPPAPPIATYLDKINGLKKAANVASAIPSKKNISLRESSVYDQNDMLVKQVASLKRKLHNEQCLKDDLKWVIHNNPTSAKHARSMLHPDKLDEEALSRAKRARDMLHL